MKKRKHSKKGRRKSSIGKTSPVGILIDVALGVAGFLGTNFASNTIRGEETIPDAGFKVLIPQAAAIISPVVKPQLKPLAVGAAISALIILMTQNPDKKTAMVDSKLMIAGDDDGESVDLSDLSPDQQEMLGRYLMSGDRNSDPLGANEVIMTGADKVIMTGSDVSDPLS